RIWTSSNNGLKLMAGIPHTNESIKFISLPAPFSIPALHKNIINDIFEDANNNMWFCTSEGVIKISEDGSCQFITVKDGLPSNIVRRIFQDKEKNIWFGTELGLSKMVTKSLIRQYPIENGVWSSDNLYILHPFNKNLLLVSTLKGVQVFNKLTGRVAPVVNGNTEHFFCVVPNSDPPLLLGPTKIVRFDTLNMQLDKTIKLPIANRSKIINDKAGDFFVSDLQHLFFSSGNTLQKILDYRVSFLLIDKQGYLWAGTWANGLFRIHYNFINGNFKIVSTDHFLPNEYIRSLYEDSKGTIWAGTRYQGVYLFSKKNKDSFTISTIDQTNGLTSNFVKGIREDRYGNFWIAYYQGLDKLIKTATGLRVFNFSKVNDYYASSIIGMETDENNSIWLATTEGLTQIIDGELEKQEPLPVYITKVFSHDSVYALNATTIQLNHQQNQLQFEFSAPGYINEKQLLYSYRLTGNSATDWTAATNQHVVSFASLQPGRYLFEVRTLGWNGEWGKPAAVEFIISPPFWKTGWFISIISLCILILGFLFVRGREKSFKSIAEEKLKVQQLSAGQYKSKLELELIINYFSSSLIGKNTEEDVLWDVAYNLIGRLGFVDCMIYLWNADKSKMIQKAGFGPKGSIEEINRQPFDVVAGLGVVGYVMQTKEPLLIPDTSVDSRYRPDEMIRLSEVTVPVIYNNELVGIIDCEHPEKNYFTTQHLQILNTIATLMANKIKSVEAEQLQQQADIEIYSMNEQLLKAKLEALRSQMNPHFIFNSLNSIDNLIQTNQKDKATTYLARFAKLIRNVLDSSKNDVVAFQKDFETLELYLQMEKFRSNDKFIYELHAEDELLQGDYMVPPLIVQPFVENAIHHGLLNKQTGDRRLTVSALLENDCIKYTVKDNGVGRARAQLLKELNKPEQKSYGIDITTERIQLHNRTGANGNVAITDLFENNQPSGTSVELKVKIFENN
ncbi:MAG: two-component regulator propeller domain-containing protein, partial [Chitinophagaceae bacterium]